MQIDYQVQNVVPLLSCAQRRRLEDSVQKGETSPTCEKSDFGVNIVLLKKSRCGEQRLAAVEDNKSISRFIPGNCAANPCLRRPARRAFGRPRQVCTNPLHSLSPNDMQRIAEALPPGEADIFLFSCAAPKAGRGVSPHTSFT